MKRFIKTISLTVIMGGHFVTGAQETWVKASTEAGRTEAEEAPHGFDDLTNGFVSQSQHEKNREVFERQVTIAEGLGPVYTARSCAACHGHPMTGGGSQVTHTIAGRPDPFFGFIGATAELGNGSI